MVAGRAFFVVFLRFQLLCGAAGVPGAACCVRPGCSVCPPSTAHDLPSSVWPLCVPVGGGPPARSPHASLTARSGRSRGPPWPCRHPPAPRPGPTTTHGHRSQDPHPGLGPTSAKKFALLASISVHTRKSSPSARKTPQNQRFFACRANFFAVCSRIHSCWASFFAPMRATAASQHPPTTSPETADAFARTKQPNSGRFPPAKVSRVSCTPRRAVAKASPVSPSPDATSTAQTSRGMRKDSDAGGTLAT